MIILSNIVENKIQIHRSEFGNGKTNTNILSTRIFTT